MMFTEIKTPYPSSLYLFSSIYTFCISFNRVEDTPYRVSTPTDSGRADFPHPAPCLMFELLSYICYGISSTAFLSYQFLFASVLPFPAQMQIFPLIGPLGIRPFPLPASPGFHGTMGISDSLHPSGFLPFVRTPYLYQGDAGPLLTCGDCESWLAL